MTVIDSSVLVETVAAQVPENCADGLDGVTLFSRGAFCFGFVCAGVVGGLSMIGAGELAIVSHKATSTNRDRAAVVRGLGFKGQLPSRSQ